MCKNVMAYTVASFSLWVIDSAVLYLNIYLSSSYFWSSYNISIFLFHFNPREQLVISHKDHVANVCSRYKARKRKQQVKKNFEPAFLCLFNFSYRVKARKLLQTTHTNKNSC